MIISCMYFYTVFILIFQRLDGGIRGEIRKQALDHFNAEGSNVRTGPRLNIKTVLSTYGDFHVKDKTAVRTSYL